MHLVPPPVSLLVAVRVDPEIVVVDVGIIDVAVDVDIVEYLGVALIDTVPTDLVRCGMRSNIGRPQLSKRRRILTVVGIRDTGVTHRLRWTGCDQRVANRVRMMAIYCVSDIVLWITFESFRATT